MTFTLYKFDLDLEMILALSNVHWKTQCTSKQQYNYYSFDIDPVTLVVTLDLDISAHTK